MDEDIRAQIVNEIWATEYSIQRSVYDSRQWHTWKGYRMALSWMLYLIDGPDTDEDPVLTAEELHIEQKTKS